MFKRTEKLKWFYSKHPYTHHLNSASAISNTCLSLSIYPSPEWSFFKKCKSVHALKSSMTFHWPENKIQILAHSLQALHKMVAASSPACPRPCLPFPSVTQCIFMLLNCARFYPISWPLQGIFLLLFLISLISINHPGLKCYLLRETSTDCLLPE